MKRVWMPLYIADYLKDTTHLTALESGAYLHLIMAYWVSGGRLPQDDKQLSTIAKMSLRTFKKSKPTLSAFFGPGWTHKRIDAELKREKEQALKAAERGRKGADARWSEHAPSNASSTPQAMLGDAPSPSPSHKEDDDEGAGIKSPMVSEESNSLADEVATIVGHDLRFVPPAWCGASYVAQKWLLSGWRREIILASVREQMARRNGDPPDRITYFEKGIAGAHARHEAPLPAGTPERPHAKTGNGNIIPAADRLIERIRAFDRQIPDAAGGRSGAGSAPVRLLSTGGRE